MPIYIGNKQLANCYLGNRQIKEIYKGSQLIWSKSQDDSGDIEDVYYTLDVSFNAPDFIRTRGVDVYKDDNYLTYLDTDTSIQIKEGSKVQLIMNNTYGGNYTITPEFWSSFDSDASVQIDLSATCTINYDFEDIYIEDIDNTEFVLQLTYNLDGQTYTDRYELDNLSGQIELPACASSFEFVNNSTFLEWNNDSDGAYAGGGSFDLSITQTDNGVDGCLQYDIYIQ